MLIAKLDFTILLLVQECRTALGRRRSRSPRELEDPSGRAHEHREGLNFRALAVVTGIVVGFAGTTFRFLGSVQISTVFGELTHTGFVADAGGLINPGETWHFHAWYRDPSLGPCATGANLTNLYSVTFVP